MRSGQLCPTAEAALFARLVPIAGANPRCRQRCRLAPVRSNLGPSPAYDAMLPTYTFAGTMDYPPNVDAAIWFAEAILPRSAAPARISVLHRGRQSQPGRCGGWRGPGRFVTGRVPDIRPYVAHAAPASRRCASPRHPNKVLEAMALAGPVVATAGALEGIEAEPGQEVNGSQDTGREQFAAACCCLAEHGPTTGSVRRHGGRGSVTTIGRWRLHGFDDLLRPTGRSRIRWRRQGPGSIE